MSVEVLFADICIKSDCLGKDQQSKFFNDKLTARLVLPGVISTCSGPDKSEVLFTDDSHFTVACNDGRIHVWRRRQEKWFTDATE